MKNEKRWLKVSNVRNRGTKMTSKARFVLVWSVLCFCASIVQTYRDNDNVACFFVCFLFFLLFFHTMGAGSRVMIA